MINFSKNKFLVLGFVFAAILLIPVNDVYADHAEVAIGAVEESGFSQACVETGCYTPGVATVDVGGVVTMTNTDPTGVHTFTSGTVNGFTPSPDGVFDSGVLMSNDAFEWSPTEAGTVPYYCMLHTWMVGEIIVQEVAAEEHADDHGDDHGDMEMSHSEETIPQLSITTFEIDQENNTFTVIGNGAYPGTHVETTITRPDGFSYGGGVLFSDDSGNFLFPSHQLTNGSPVETWPGIWTVTVCDWDHDVACAPIASFTIEPIVEDPYTDTTPPVVTVPNNISVPTMLSGYQVVPLNVTATDNVEIAGNINGQPYPYCTIPALTGSGTTGLSMTPSNMAIGMDFQIGTTIVTCSVSDTSGNESTASFTVTVNDPALADTTYITVPDDITITTSDFVNFTNSTGTYYGAIAWNGGGVSFNNIQNPTSYLGGPYSGQGGNGLGCYGNFSPQGWLNGPVTFPLDITTVTCGAIYGGVEHTETFTVTVIQDTDNVPTIPSSVTVTVPSNQVITTTNSSHAFTYAFSPVSSLGPQTGNNGIVCDYVPQSDTGLSLGQYNLYYYPDGDSFDQKHGTTLNQQWERGNVGIEIGVLTDDTHFRTFPEGTTTVTCGSIVVDRWNSWAAYGLWDDVHRTGEKFPVSSLNGTSSFDVTVIFDDGTIPTVYPPVTVPSNQVITTTNSSHAFTYAFSPVSSLGPQTGNNGIVCDYVPQSDTGLSLGQHNLYYYPDGDSFYSKHGNTFSQQWESNGRYVDGTWITDDTHFRTFPEGTTTVTCGSIVVDRWSSWAAFELWSDQMYRADDWMGAPAGPFQKFPVSSLNGTSSFDVTVIFDDEFIPEPTIIENSSSVSVAGTMKKSTGSLDFSVSNVRDSSGSITFSKDGINTQFELRGDDTYDVVLLPGEYSVRANYWIYDAVTNSNHNFDFRQSDVMISSDQTFDIVFPITTITGKVTDASGNNLENMRINFDSYTEDNGLRSTADSEVLTNSQGVFSVESTAPPENWIYDFDGWQNNVNYNADLRIYPPDNSEYFEKGIENIDPRNALNIVLESFEDNGVSVAGTMKKSTGSLDFSVSNVRDSSGSITFSKDGINTQFELRGDDTYDVVLLPGEYSVRANYWIYDAVTNSNHNFDFRQSDVMISSDQTFDIVFPITTITGKVTDASGNNLENMRINFDSYTEDNGLRSTADSEVLTNSQGVFSVESTAPPENWIYDFDGWQNNVNYNADLRIYPPDNSEYFEKGIENIDPRNALNIVLESFEDNGVSVAGTMKKSTGSLDFSVSNVRDSSGSITFSKDGINTQFELRGDDTYDVVLLPGEYSVRANYWIYDAVTNSNHNFDFRQSDVMISSDQTFDIVFPITTITGKVTDASGNNLENMRINFDSYTEDNGLRSTADSEVLTNSQGVFSVESTAPPENWIYDFDGWQNNVNYNADLRIYPPDNSEYFEKGIENIDPRNALNIQLVGINDPLPVPGIPDEIKPDIDNSPPEFEKVKNITVDATITSNGAIVNYELPQVTDDNSGVDLGPTCIPASGSFFQTGITEITCSASDWAGNVGTTSFTVFVESQIAAPVEIMTDVTLEIGQSQYTTDDSIFVTGVASPFTENNISIQVEDPLENIVLVEQITAESSGVYTGIISPNFLWNTSGNYTMSATYGNSTANTSFEFEFVEPVIDELISATGITLQTNTSQYFIGDMITIESALTDVGSGYEIGIFVTDPSGTLRTVQMLNTDDSGSVTLSVKAQDDWIAGEYEILVFNDELEKIVTVGIVKPLPEITLSPTVTTTESGNAITSYDAGDMAYFETSLLSESTSDVLVTINVVDSDDTTLGVAFFKSIVGKGNSELVLGFKIPEDTADGTAKIYVNTYTDWIDQGGVVIGSELLSEVNINGVIIEEPVVVEPVVEEPVLPENTIPRLSSVSDIVQPASFTTGSIVSYTLPIATSETTALSPTCTPAPGSLFPIGSTQVTCTATNAVGNTGMTSFMVTINPIAQVADQTLSVKVGKDSYNNLEPIFVTGSVGTVTGDPVNLEVRDTQNNLISIEQVSPKESGVYTVVLTSNELWNTSGEYRVIANYGDVIALDEFAFELEEVEEIIPEKIPTSLFIDTLDSAYVLGDVVAIGVNLVDAGAGEPILLEIRDSNNDQVLIQSLNTDSDGVAIFFYQLDSTGESGVYSVTATSDEWNFSNSQNIVVVPQIPDITIGDVVSTLQDGTAVDSFESGDMGYFQTPVISESVSDVLITVNIFDVQNTPLGLAHFNSKVVDDTFDIVLGLQIPQDAMPGLATVYINTYTNWPNEGGVPILEEQVSFIEISPASTTSLTVSSEEPEPVTVPELVPVFSNISVQTESTAYTTGNSIVISGTVENLTEYEQPVVIMIVSPDGNLVTIDQVLTDSSGNYSTTVNAGGTMSSNGEYEVRAQYGVHKITTVFDFTRN